MKNTAMVGQQKTGAEPVNTVKPMNALVWLFVFFLLWYLGSAIYPHFTEAEPPVGWPEPPSGLVISAVVLAMAYVARRSWISKK